MHQHFQPPKQCTQLQSPHSDDVHSPNVHNPHLSHSTDLTITPSDTSAARADTIPSSQPTKHFQLFNGKTYPSSPQRLCNLPSALDHLSLLISDFAEQRRRAVFFLDYDGTLSPIVDNPDLATIPPTTRTALTALASRFTTAIVTGRSKQKVMNMIKLDNLIYAASHGFDIEVPNGTISHRVACDYIPVIQRATRDLQTLAETFPGAHVEDNFLSLSLHYRHLNPSLKSELVGAVNELAERHGLHRHDGKMVHELRPRYDWHKGKAVEFLLTKLQLAGPEVVPIYIGDDIADETAFKAVQGRGVSIVVGDESMTRCTSADFRLRDPLEVGQFLMRFANTLYV